MAELALKFVTLLVDELKPHAINGLKATYLFHKRCDQLATILESTSTRSLIRDLVDLARKDERDWNSFLSMCALVEEAHSLVLAARVPERTMLQYLKLALDMGSVNRRMKQAIRNQGMVRIQSGLQGVQTGQNNSSNFPPSYSGAQKVAQQRAIGVVRMRPASTPQVHPRFVDYRDFVADLNDSLRGNRRVGVLGMPGVGKTTVVNSFFVQQESRYHMAIRLVVGRTPNVKQLLRSAYVKFNPDMTVPISEGELLDHLRSQFSESGKLSVLLFLDDAWEMQHWRDLDFATHQGCHINSRLIITTRDGGVIREDGLLIDEFEEKRLVPLGFDDARDLLLRHACNGEPPQADSSLVVELVKNCHGLPNTISLVGSLLRDCPENKWGNVLQELKRMPSESSEDLHLKIREVVNLSYDALEPAMRHCMRIWAAFPEDHRVHREYLISIWSTQMPIVSMQSWEQASVYLDTLVHRSLIMHDEQENAYHVHDTVWHFMSQECEEEQLTEQQCRSMFKPSGALEIRQKGLLILCLFCHTSNCCSVWDCTACFRRFDP